MWDCTSEACRVAVVGGVPDPTAATVYTAPFMKSPEMTTAAVVSATDGKIAHWADVAVPVFRAAPRPS